MSIICFHRVWPKFTPIKKKTFTQSLHSKNTVRLQWVYTRFTCQVQACKPRINPVLEHSETPMRACKCLHKVRSEVYSNQEKKFSNSFHLIFLVSLTEFTQRLHAISKHVNQNLKWPYLGNLNQSSVWDEPKNRFNKRPWSTNCARSWCIWPIRHHMTDDRKWSGGSFFGAPENQK